MKVAMVLPALLLQRPRPKSGIKVHIRCLEDRLERWKKGDTKSLRHECLFIQSNLSHRHHENRNKVKKARVFQKLVSQGNVNVAIRLITEQGGSGSLSAVSNLMEGQSKTTYSLNIRLEYLPHHNPLVMSHLSASLTPSSSNRSMVIPFDPLVCR